ncbi:hypothetical protein ACEN33_10505 [Ruoffia sp. FAM 24228]|uniref:hypothetical protein n=1 Tax=unclassified Ruoffia TaxID=2862149 RepID=UPI0038872970
MTAYSLSQSPTVQFINQSLEDALTKLPEQHGLMLHTEQGFHNHHGSTYLKKTTFVRVCPDEGTV